MDVEGVEVMEVVEVCGEFLSCGESWSCWWLAEWVLWWGRRLRRKGLAFVEMSIHFSAIEIPGWYGIAKDSSGKIRHYIQTRAKINDFIGCNVRWYGQVKRLAWQSYASWENSCTAERLVAFNTSIWMHGAWYLGVHFSTTHVEHRHWPQRRQARPPAQHHRSRCQISSVTWLNNHIFNFEIQHSRQSKGLWWWRRGFPGLQWLQSR